MRDAVLAAARTPIGRAGKGSFAGFRPDGLADIASGATVTRYCASSLRTTRMAFRAIRAGERRLGGGQGMALVLERI